VITCTARHNSLSAMFHYFYFLVILYFSRKMRHARREESINFKVVLQRLQIPTRGVSLKSCRFPKRTCAESSCGANKKRSWKYFGKTNWWDEFSWQLHKKKSAGTWKRSNTLFLCVNLTKSRRIDKKSIVWCVSCNCVTCGYGAKLQTTDG
jgi:hypothetical protein